MAISFVAYTVTFDPNGGNWNGDTEPKSLTTDTDGKLSADNIPADPIRDGYAFEGWYMEGKNEAEEPTQQKIDPSQDSFSEDTDVYAGWTESILDLKLSDYATQAEAQAAIQDALNGDSTRVNVSLGTSTADAFYIQGGLTVPKGKVLYLDCPFTLGSADGSAQGTLTVNGTLSLNSSQTSTVYSGSKISVENTGTFMDYGKVTVNSGGAVENAGTFNTGYGGKDYLIIEAGGTFTNTGKLYLGYFNAFTNSGTFTNAAGGVLDASSGSASNTGTITNDGTYYGNPITGGTVDGANAGQVTAGNSNPEEP